MSADGRLDPTTRDAGVVDLRCYRCAQPITWAGLAAHADCADSDGLIPYSVEVLGAR